MAYGIIRVKKLKRAEVRATIEHNYRLVKVHNADDKKERQNEYVYEHDDIENRLDKYVLAHEKATGKAIRKDAVQAVEILITHSPEAQNIDHVQYFQDARDFVKKRFPDVLSVAVHKDEKTPHLHILIAPRDGEKFNAKKLLGNKKDLSKLQDDFFKIVSKKYGLERGEKGTGREHIPVAKLRQKTEKNQALQNENMKLKSKLSESRFQRLERLAASEEKIRSDAQKLEQEKEDFKFEKRDLKEDLEDLTKKNEKLQQEIKELDTYYKDRDVNEDLKKSNDQYRKDYIAVCEEKNTLKKTANENAKALEIEKEKNAKNLEDALSSQAEKLTAQANQNLEKERKASYEKGKQDGLESGLKKGKIDKEKVLLTLSIKTDKDLKEKQALIKKFELAKSRKNEQGRSL